MEEFIKKYSLSKTLRFELKPIGKTLHFIEKNSILKNDEKKAESYKIMKKIIDDYHKSFIEIAMNQVSLSSLKEFSDLYNASVDRKKEESYKKELLNVQTKLRKEIVKGFDTGKAKDIYQNLFKKELITTELYKFARQEDKEFIKEFKNFTTYFTGFNENRKNIYTSEEISTAIAYRLVHENLPKFLDNIKTFNIIKEKFDKSKIKEIEKQLESIIQGTSLTDIFTLDYYNNILSQSGIDFINHIIGGYTEEQGKKKIKGLNEYINLYNQEQVDRKERIPKLRVLYKQILSDRDSISWLPDAFEDDDENTASQKVLDAINLYYRDNLLCFQSNDRKETENVLEKTNNLLTTLSTYDLSKIYIRNDRAITDISQAIFKDYSVIKSALEYTFQKTLIIGKKGITKKQECEIENYLKQSYFSIAEIEKALFEYKNETDTLNDLNEFSHPIAEYFTNHFKSKKKEEKDKEFDLIANIKAKYSCIQGILNSNYPKDKQLNKDKKTIDDIKAFLDSIMELLHFVKPLALPNDNTFDKDENFYSHFNPFYEQLELLISLYNKVRNFAAKKPYSTEKFKLNFENATLLNGWDVNKEEANTSLLFIKDNLYYLGIMDKNHNKIFRHTPINKSENTYSKINYKLLPGANKMLPKVFFSKQNLEYYNPSENILRIRNHSTHTKGGEPQKGYDKHVFNIDDYRNMIDFYKQSINKHQEWKNFEFKFSDTDNYDSIDSFYREVEQQGYKITYNEIDESYIDQLVNEGKLYLFQIYNKDFSEFSKGNQNMHTMYWNALFDTKNLKDVVYKLNGQAEIFYRKKSIDEYNIITHKANEPIDKKNPNAIKKNSTFEYDIIKDRRYTEDKFQFHVPITINYKAIGTNNINNEVLEYLKNNPEVNIIGLDRGERHLIYLTLINQNGEILLQESLNTIVNKKHNIETPYHTLLQNKEDERANARQNWGVIENIKELKEGYISQVVHKITKLMVQYNAIVVMEDLNTGFKRGRFKVEKQVYQKLEKMLIDKLNYLVFKDKDPNEIGGLYKALQLTNKFESFQKMGKHSGFLFYVPAWNTSKIDPTTGFVNLFYTKYESITKTKEFFDKFKSIRYNSKKEYFEFEFNYNDFTTKAEGTKTDWTVCTYGDRIKTFRNSDKNNQWDNQEVNLTEQFELFFGKNNITYGDANCIKNQIVEQSTKEFYTELLYLFKLSLQMRNSITNSEVDYLISPVMNSEGKFYDSREADTSLPKDADANGAYHIAKKGLQWIQKINEFDVKDQKDNTKYDWKALKFEKTNKAWLNFVQNKSAIKVKA